MKKTKIESGKSVSKSMLGQKTGSSLDIKTNQDFNNEHPDYDASGNLRGISNPKGDRTNTRRRFGIQPTVIIFFVFVYGLMCTSCMDMEHGMK